MIVAESLRTRRLVGRLDRGADLLTQLVAVCRAHHVRAGTVRAVGALEDAVVGEWDQATRAARTPRRFDSAFEILSLSGTIAEQAGAPALSAFVSLSRARDNGIELIGGRLVAGRVFACEFVIETFDDVTVPATIDPATGLLLWAPASLPQPAAATPAVAPGHVAAPTHVLTPAPSPPRVSPVATPPAPVPAPVPAPAVAAPPVARVTPAPPAPTPIRAVPTPAVAPPPPPPPVAVRAPEPEDDEPGEPAVSFEAPARTSWSEVMAASERRSEQAAAVEEEEPLAPPTGAAGEVQVRPGDLIDHPKFGRVQVERVDGDQEYVSARLRNQRLIRLSLEVLTLVPAGQLDGKNVFRAVAGNLR